MNDLIQIFKKSLDTGFIDKSILSNRDYQPELLVNQKIPPRKVLSTLLHELDQCSEFFISVAFVSTCGVATIINKLKELDARGIKGKILVSQYLNFTQPEALKRLSQFENIELRIAVTGNVHIKGYIFRHKNHYNLIVGSSNLTANALSTNKEWNLKVSALDQSGLVVEVVSEFISDFDDSLPVTHEFIKSYEKVYESQLLLNHKNTIQSTDDSELIVKPNSMQVEALNNLKNLRANGKNKALIISATGTGKTYLSAFDAKEFNPNKLLFVVHRLTIAEDAMKSFKRVFGNSKSMGLYSGNQRDLESDFVFSTIQTISKADHLDAFDRSHFDYIIVDESHRSGADSYLRFLEHFEPKFLLGMTATPERTDGHDIFKLFDHNIAYEIRLNRAMQEDMLSSFHYYGVSDLTIDNIKVDNKSDFRFLLSTERVERIIEQASFYGSDNGITRGLIFCSRKDEAIELSKLLNQRGLKTVALTGDSTEDARVNSIEKLETDNLDEKLDYIITVDIFNEGIDIPKVNQIIMLRPTESAIIFIQQLGRGLRKIDGKSYLTVIDFIGNYENNYLIPIALYGDTSYNKDTLRKLISEGSRMIPGSSTINFDEITKEKIFQSIDTANMQQLADLRKDYNLLKYKLGRTPMMVDFIEHGSRDPYLFVEYAGSYYNFVVKVDKQLDLSLSKQQIRLLELFSKEINNSKRLEESLILKLLLDLGELSVTELKEYVFKKYGFSVSDQTIESCIRNLNFEFVRENHNGRMLSVREKYDLDIIQIDNGKFDFSQSVKEHLIVGHFREYLIDSVNYSIHEFNRLFDINLWQDGFVLYRKYSRKDVFRILNVAENPVAQNVGGYLVSQDNKHCPIFVNYHKEDHISESTKYEDEFVNNKEFDWMSKSNRTLKSKDVQSILGKNGPIRLPLFIKKNNDEGLEFYYMGDVTPQMNKTIQTSITNDSGKLLPVVKMRFDLDNPVVPSIFNYLEEKSVTEHPKTDKKVNIVHIQQSIDFNEDVKNPIPLYDFYAAAGSFSELQSENNFTLIEGPENSSDKNYFACKVIGESMNRVIPNGSICLFRPYNGGSRNGKIMLIENRNIQDPDFNSAFTVKTYSSRKEITEDSFKHESIVLKPNSFDSSYKDIVLTEENSIGMRVIGEFVSILKPE